MVGLPLGTSASVDSLANWNSCKSSTGKLYTQIVFLCLDILEVEADLLFAIKDENGSPNI